MDELEVRTRMGGKESILDFLDKNLEDNLKKTVLSQQCVATPGGQHYASARA